MSNKIFVSVDVSNLYYSIKKRFLDRKLDYKKVLSLCRQRGWVYRSTCYASDMNGKADDFFECLRQIGYEIKTKPVREYTPYGGQTVKKANLDVDMAVDIIRYCDHYDELILMCADGDFIPAVKYVQERGIKVHVLACAINNDLRQVADSWQEISPALLERNDAIAKTA